jgi:hypothetical protein
VKDFWLLRGERKKPTRNLIMAFGYSTGEWYVHAAFSSPRIAA